MHSYESKFDIILSFWTVSTKFISLSFIFLVGMYDYQDGKYHENLETKGSSSFNYIREVVIDNSGQMKGIPAIIAGACAGATEITVTYPFECEHCYLK